MATRRATTLKSIAAQARISIATVSRVLRGLGQYDGRTRERVLAVAGQLGYRPNLLVEGIRTGHTRTIGVITHFQDEFFGRISVGIHDALIAADHVPIFVWPRRRRRPTAGCGFRRTCP